MVKQVHSRYQPNWYNFKAIPPQITVADIPSAIPRSVKNLPLNVIKAAAKARILPEIPKTSVHGMSKPQLIKYIRQGIQGAFPGRGQGANPASFSPLFHLRKDLLRTQVDILRLAEVAAIKSGRSKDVKAIGDEEKRLQKESAKTDKTARKFTSIASAPNANSIYSRLNEVAKKYLNRLPHRRGMVNRKNHEIKDMIMANRHAYQNNPDQYESINVDRRAKLLRKLKSQFKPKQSPKPRVQ